MHPILTLALALALLGWTPAALAQDAAAATGTGTDTGQAEAAAPVLPAITVSEVRATPMVDRIIASGLISPVEEVQVAPLIEGQPLEQLLVDVGDMVAEGQVLAVLSRSMLELGRSEAVASLAAAQSGIAQAEAQLVEAEAAAAEARRVADRTAILREQGTAAQAQADTANANATSAAARVNVAQQGLEAARAQLSLAEARLENVELQLTRTDVKAPVAGLVTARNAKLGAIATGAGAPMFLITRDGALELRADVTETSILRVAEGQPARLRAVGMTDTLGGTVRLVEPTIDPTTRLGRVRISVESSARLRAGMFVEAEIIAAERATLAVPISAVGSGPEGVSVMKVVDGVVERAVVTTGIRDGGLVEIVTGLAPGDQVVTKAGAFVRAGDRINPVPAGKPSN